MRMKTEMFNNKKYDIIDDVMLQVKNKNKIYTKKTSLEMMQGKFRIIASYKKREIENITFFLPEYVSQLYSNEPITDESNLEFVKIILTSNDLKYPINIKNKNLELFDNGFFIKHKKIKIHPSYFFDKIVGLLFDFE